MGRVSAQSSHHRVSSSGALSAALDTLSSRYAPIGPYLSWGLFGIGTLLVAGIMLGLLPYGGVMGDGAAWYHVETPYDWSDRPAGVAEYRYAPAFLWITEPFRWLPFPVYAVAWAGLHLLAVAWLGPWTILLAFDDVIVGNVNTFLAVATVLAVRYPGLWAFALLTKVTPGVGVLYHVREWRKMLVAVGVTLGIMVLGHAADPELWQAWADSLQSNGYPNLWTASLPIRLAVGAVLCLAASRWVWLLPVGMLIAMPGLWPASFALLAAIPRLTR